MPTIGNAKERVEFQGKEFTCHDMSTNGIVLNIIVFMYYIIIYYFNVNRIVLNIIGFIYYVH